jgi:hypothetical protein
VGQEVGFTTSPPKLYWRCIENKNINILAEYLKNKKLVINSKFLTLQFSMHKKYQNCQHHFSHYHLRAEWLPKFYEYESKRILFERNRFT